MTEDEARSIVETLVEHAALARLERLATLVVEENARQNLIAGSTVASIWSRHILDSIQLVQWAGSSSGTWLDIGTGGGFPGLAIAAVMPSRVFLLVEPRRRRADFLRTAAADLGLDHVDVRQDHVETVECTAAVISARAVAPIDKLFTAAFNCATPQTRWLMPRGAGYAGDVEHARTGWKGMFHVEQSLSDSAAGVVLANDVTPR